MSILIKDHLGQEFKSVSAMCRHWNIGIQTFLARKSRGVNIEDALTRKKCNGDCIPARDHLGKDYVSLSAMARAYGLSPRALYSRLNRGKQLKDALTKPIDKKRSTKRKLTK